MNISEPEYNLKYILKLAWPVFIEYTLSATVGLADTVMVSNLGSTAVSAVGLVDSINMVFLMIYNAIASGTTVVVSQAFGAHDHNTVKKTAGQSMLFGFLLMFVIGAGIFILRRPIFTSLYPDVESAVTRDALTYMAITAFSYPLMSLITNLSGVLRGISETKSVMFASLVVNAINIGLNYVFIYALEMGVAGAALATCVGRLVGGIILGLRVIRFCGKDVFSFSNLKFTGTIIKRIMGISLPTGLDTTLFQAGKLIVSVFVGKMGTAMISANTIATSTFSMINIPGSAFQVAGMTVAGQCWGANRKLLARKNLLKCTYISIIALIVLSAILWFPAPFIIGIYKPEPGAFEEAVRLFRTQLVIIPLFWPTAFCLASGLKANDDITFSTVVSVASMWVFRVGFAWILGLKMQWGPFGVFVAMGMDWVCRSLFYLIRVIRGKKYGLQQ